MKRTLCLFSLANLVMLGGAVVADAQLVQVGPGYVKAPFVRVYRTPNGTAVRAPFTRVERAAPPHVHPFHQSPYVNHYGEPQVVPHDVDTTAADVTLLERQRRLVASSARRLDRDLLRFRTGSHWQAFLRLPPELLHVNRIGGRGAMIQPDPAAVQNALNNFDSVAASDEYRQISQLNSFRSTHRLLREYVSLLSLPNTDPTPPGQPSNALGTQPSVVVPPTVEQSPEELPFPQLEVEP